MSVSNRLMLAATMAAAILVMCVVAPQSARAGDEAGLTQTSFVSVGPVAGARVLDDRGWSGLIGAEVAFLPYTGPTCSVVPRAASASSQPEGCEGSRLWLPGLALGVAYAPAHDQALVSLEAEVYNRSLHEPGTFSFGAGAGPTLAVASSDQADGVDFGGQVTLWAAITGVIPYVRGGWMLDDGGFAEVGLMLKAPLPLL